MKRYLVFANDNYYPSGGWRDFQKDFDTLEEAVAYANELKDSKTWDRSHVVDTTDLSITHEVW